MPPVPFRVVSLVLASGFGKRGIEVGQKNNECHAADGEQRAENAIEQSLLRAVPGAPNQPDQGKGDQAQHAGNRGQNVENDAIGNSFPHGIASQCRWGPAGGQRGDGGGDCPSLR